MTSTPIFFMSDVKASARSLRTLSLEGYISVKESFLPSFALMPSPVRVQPAASSRRSASAGSMLVSATSL